MLPNPNVERLRALKESGLPIVSVHAGYDGLDVPTVEVDDVGGGQAVAEHLAALGHRRVGLIMKLDDVQGSRRLQGFLSGAVARGIPFDARWCRFFTTETKRAVARRFVERWIGMSADERPTAVFCYNDEIAIDLIQHLYRAGLNVPEDVSVVGFDDAPLAEALPTGLTTVAHPQVAMGEQVAECVLDAIQGRPVLPQRFPAPLVVRGTTRPCPVAVG
jgi:GntR family transcriptional regulator of arabinose operon